MNKKFWVLLATSAMLATGVMATGCAAQKHQVPTAVSAAVEATAETPESAPEQYLSLIHI